MAGVYRGLWVVAYRELLRFTQDRPRMVSSFAFPLMFLLIFGAGFSNIIGTLTPGVEFMMFMYPGIIAMSVLTNSLFAGVSIVWDREFGFLKEVLVAPISRTGVVLGKAVGGSMVALGQTIVLLALAPFMGLTVTPLLLLKLIPTVAIVSLCLSSLGILVASRMRSQQGFQVVIQALIFPLIFLAGVFFPISSAPDWLQVISKINPLTYGVDAIRQIFLGDELAAATAASGREGVALGVTIFDHTMSAGEDLLVMALLGIVLMSAAIWAFSRQE